jgi:hypothetical protein
MSTHQLLREEVDIYQYPPKVDLHTNDKGAQCTTGDLHGNSMKLLYLLISHGVLQNISKEDYAELTEIYRKNTLDLEKEDLNRFNSILAKATWNKDAAAIRLIGDECLTSIDIAGRRQFRLPVSTRI